MSAAHPTLTGDGETFFVSHLGIVEAATAFVCRRHRLSAADADDFASEVKVKLIENDYAVLRKFQGRCSLRAYLTVVIQRLFLDYRIAAWGKWRPSAEAKRSGAVGVLLEQFMTRDGYSFDEACALLAAKHGVSETRSALEALAGRLPMRVKRRFEAEDALESVADERPRVDPVDIRDHEATADRVGDALRSATGAFEAEDRLMLALRYEDGRSVAEIAAILRVDQKALYRRFERLLKELRNVLQAKGISSSAALEMFESPAVSIEWRDDADSGKRRGASVSGERSA